MVGVGAVAPGIFAPRLDYHRTEVACAHGPQQSLGICAIGFVRPQHRIQGKQYGIEIEFFERMQMCRRDMQTVSCDAQVSCQPLRFGVDKRFDRAACAKRRIGILDASE